jgi:hypothetical protein
VGLEPISERIVGPMTAIRRFKCGIFHKRQQSRQGGRITFIPKKTLSPSVLNAHGN